VDDTAGAYLYSRAVRMARSEVLVALAGGLLLAALGAVALRFLA
jgi:hypothetical protein